MSSSSALAAESDAISNANGLLVIPDGSALWEQPETTEPYWQSSVITTLTEQMPCSSMPVLIGAPTIPAQQLVNSGLGFVNGWADWERSYAEPNKLAVTIRCLDGMYTPVVRGSDANSRTEQELWLLTREHFHSGAGGQNESMGWRGAFRRLGFDVSRWNTNLSLAENLNNKRITDNVPSPTRPGSIIVGELTPEKLLERHFKLT